MLFLGDHLLEIDGLKVCISFYLPPPLPLAGARAISLLSPSFPPTLSLFCPSLPLSLRMHTLQCVYTRAHTHTRTHTHTCT